jgi:uncharacterized protein (DUF305 family)
MCTKNQAGPRRRLALPSLAIATATAILVLAPSIGMAVEPMSNEAGAAMPMNDPTLCSMMESDHARMHERMAIEHGRMHESMPMKGGMAMHGMSRTGDVDHDFAANMRRHHEMGVRMAQAQIKDGRDPEMTSVARDIVTAQQAEIGRLDRWLAAHTPAAPKSE